VGVIPLGYPADEETYHKATRLVPTQLESSMKTCVFTPSHETGILVATSSWTPEVMTLAWGAKARDRRCHPGPIFFRPLMVKGAFLRPDR
jgi:hypothetical protein